MPRILHILSQLPGRTGSGVTLEALVRHASEKRWEQQVICATPTHEAWPEVGELPETQIAPLPFGTTELPFPVPGMSDVMPYRSTVFSSMTCAQLASYRRAWRDHLARTIDRFRPEIIHTHHIWLLSAWVRDAAPEIPVVAHCHATGLRQLRRCPDFAPEVIAGCARIDAFCVLHDADAETLRSTLAVGRDRIHRVGAGYREELFHRRGRIESRPLRIVYAGKLSAAKGLPSLLDAFATLRARQPLLELHIAGTGDGQEAEQMQRRIAATAGVVAHGMLAQQQLADLFRSARVCVLPSFYEGLPLVLVEALACGCRVVATDLPGVRIVLAPLLGDLLRRVPLPRLTSIDQPLRSELPAFATALAAALERSLLEGDIDEQSTAARLQDLSWSAVCRRVEPVWRSLLDA